MGSSTFGRAPCTASAGPAASCSHSLRPAVARLPAFSCRPRLAHSAAPERRSAAFATCAAAAVDAPASSAGTLQSLGPDLWNRTYYPTGADANPHIKPCGKTVPTYQPSMDMGSYVIIVNAEKVVVTGNKASQKIYTRHTGRPGSRKEETFEKLQARIPQRIVELAVRGMLPKGRLGRHLFTHLKVYKGPEHPHSAQKPTDITAKINKNAALMAAAIAV